MKKRIMPAVLFLLLFVGGEALAKVYIDLAAPAVKKLPLAIPDLKDMGPDKKDDPAKAAVKNELIDALKSDLMYSNLFNLIEKNAYLEDPARSGITEETTDFKLWRASGAQTLVKGGFSIEDNKLIVELRFFDCVDGKLVLGKKYVGSPGNPRKIAHFFTDQLYEDLTGRKGIFTTKILFVSDRTGNKEIYMSDYDGKNTMQVTRNRSINISPQWSPDGKKILYTSYKKGQPLLFMLDLRTGRDTVVSEKPGINIGGRFSPDGNQIALTLSIDKSSPELYLMDLNTGEYRRLTSNFGIDVSPAWSPDGKKIVFVSDNAGNPHLFMLDLTAGSLKRITFSGKYNSSPVWSPDGKAIAFARSDNGNFNIWVMQPDGSGMTQLTFEGNNRAPAWSPDGRHIIFSSTVKGVSSLYTINADGSGIKRLDTGAGNEKTPAWSPFLQ